MAFSLRAEASAGVKDLGVFRVIGQPNLNYVVDRQAAARYGINVADVQDAIETAVGGNAVTQVLRGEARYDLVARYQTAGGYVASVLLRRNRGTGRGFTQVDWATPALKVLGGLKLHAQATSGYGETLIDYNFQQTTPGIGVSFGD